MLDEYAAAAVLLIAGTAMGFVNTLAGAGGVLGLLAFDLAAGLAPSIANASMRPAALAIAAASAVGFATRRQRVPPRAIGYALLTLPGALLGAWCAIRLPAWVYDFALFTVVALLAWRLLRARPLEAAIEPASRLKLLAWFSVVGLHMGFLQVGAGLIAILALSHVHSRDLVLVNVAKTALLAGSGTVSLIAFERAGMIAWGPALWLAVGCGVGSFTASRWSTHRGHHVIRAFVLCVCALVLVRIVLRTITGA